MSDARRRRVRQAEQSTAQRGAQVLRRALRRADGARALMESDPPLRRRRLWHRLGSELGVLGLSVPEADGGAGGSLVDQAVAVEELGASLACGPSSGTVFLAIPALVAASAGPVRDELLAALVEGTPHSGVRRRGPGGAFDPAAVTVTASGDSLYRHRSAGRRRRRRGRSAGRRRGPRRCRPLRGRRDGPGVRAPRWSPST